MEETKDREGLAVKNNLPSARLCTIVYCQLSASNRAEASVEALPKFAALPSARLSVS